MAKIGHNERVIINMVKSNPHLPTFILADLLYPFPPIKFKGKNLNTDALHKDLVKLRKKGFIKSRRNKYVLWY